MEDDGNGTTEGTEMHGGSAILQMDKNNREVNDGPKNREVANDGSKEAITGGLDYANLQQ